jgi:hypothetical protein
MSDKFQHLIDHHQDTVNQLRERGLPTYMAANILEKLIANQDAARANQIASDDHSVSKQRA